MADNVTISEGTGTTIAADEISSVKYQRVKIALGADGAWDGDLDPGAASAANSLPVTSSTEDVARVGIVTETAPATDTASSGLNGRLQRIAQRITTLLAVFPTTIDTNSGNKSASTLRVVLATDQPTLSNAQPVTPAAGELHLGEVGGSSLTVTPTHTVDTAVYAAGDTVGGIITIANAFRASGKESILQSIHILDRSNQKPTGNLLFFNASPSAATTTDNAGFVYSTDDLKEVARVPIVTSDYVTINSKATANLSNLGRQVYATTGTSLFVVFVTDGAPDFVASTDLQITYAFLRD